jgi:hypothetical protein
VNELHDPHRLPNSPHPCSHSASEKTCATCASSARTPLRTHGRSKRCDENRRCFRVYGENFPKRKIFRALKSKRCAAGATSTQPPPRIHEYAGSCYESHLSSVRVVLVDYIGWIAITKKRCSNPLRRFEPGRCHDAVRGAYHPRQGTLSLAKHSLGEGALSGSTLSPFFGDPLWGSVSGRACLGALLTRQNASFCQNLKNDSNFMNHGKSGWFFRCFSRLRDRRIKRLVATPRT